MRGVAAGVRGAPEIGLEACRVGVAAGLLHSAPAPAVGAQPGQRLAGGRPRSGGSGGLDLGQKGTRRSDHLAQKDALALVDRGTLDFDPFAAVAHAGAVGRGQIDEFDLAAAAEAQLGMAPRHRAIGNNDIVVLSTTDPIGRHHPSTSSSHAIRRPLSRPRGATPARRCADCRSPSVAATRTVENLYAERVCAVPCGNSANPPRSACNALVSVLDNRRRSGGALSGGFTCENSITKSTGCRTAAGPSKGPNRLLVFDTPRHGTWRLKQLD